MEINNQSDILNELQYLSMQNEVIEGPIYLSAAKSCINGQAYVGPNNGTCYCSSGKWTGDC